MDFLNMGHDIWQEDNQVEVPLPLNLGIKTPTAVPETPHASASLNRDNLVTLFNGKVMLENEFKLIDSIMKSEFQPQFQVSISPHNQHTASIVPVPQSPITQQVPVSQVNSLEFQLNQKGILLLALIFCGFFITTLSLIKVWGTTDVAQQQAFQEKVDSQYRDIGKRYDRLAKVTEKLGKQNDVCISLYCGDRSRNENNNSPESNNPVEPTSQNDSHINISSDISYSSEYEQALIEVRNWKRKGYDRKRALSFISWIQRNPGSGYPDARAMKSAFEKIY